VRGSAIVALAIAGLCLGGASVARAQSDEDNPFAGVEEMVVVGSSAASLLQSQEVSAIGFDASYLEALGASDLSDISQFTPNLEIRTPFAASNPSLFIRGVGLRDFNANSSSSVAVYNDDIYMNSPAGQLAQLFDVENVEVLRGPQGGIYGRNASAGAIRVISRKPTGTFNSYLSTTYGRFNQVDVEGATEAPLIPDVMSIRIAGKMSRRDGTTRNRCGDSTFWNTDPTPGARPRNSFWARVHANCFNVGNLDTFVGPGWEVGTKPPVKKFVNDTNNWAMKSIVRTELDVLDGLDVLVNFHGGQNRGDARQFQMIGARQAGGAREPGVVDQGTNQDSNNYVDPDNTFTAGGQNVVITDPFIGNALEGDYNNAEKERLDLFGSNINATLENGDWTYQFIVGYEWNDRKVILNLDGNPWAATTGGLEPVLTNSSWQITGEARAGWDAGEDFSFQIAGMYLYESLEVDNQFRLGAFDQRFQGYTMRTRYYSVYGEAAWEPSEYLTITAGARFNYENKELNLSSDFVDPTKDPSGPDYLVSTQAETSEAREPGGAWNIRFSFHPVEDVTIYTQYARGWKGPHINGLVLSPATTSSGEALTTPVDPERVDSVEMGLKSVLFAGRLKLNGAIFYYDYNDIQVFRLRNTAGGVPVNQLINAEDADILGVEFDVDLLPFEGLGPPILDRFNVYASFAWLDSKYTDFVNTIKSSPGGVPPVTVTSTIDFSGAQMVNSPEFSFVGYVQWPLPTPYGVVVPRFDWSFKDDIFFSPENSDLVGQSALWLMNARLMYKAPSENIEVSFWVENLTDQRYTLDVFNLARFRQSILYAIGDPRTYGVTLKVQF
jgi:iron complex outermembrane receptor protein